MSDTFWYTYNPQYEREEGPYSEDEVFVRPAQENASAKVPCWVGWEVW